MGRGGCCTGKPVTGYEAKVVDDAGNEADRGNALLNMHPDRKFFYVQGRRPEFARNFGRYIQHLKSINRLSEEKKLICRQVFASKASELF